MKAPQILQGAGPPQGPIRTFRVTGIDLVQTQLRLAEGFSLAELGLLEPAAPRGRPAGDKAARFMQLCDAFDIPMLSLCDTPGFMVGPDSEKQATVRHVSRMFVAAAGLSVPFFTVVLRKGYGLGAQAMAAGSFHAPLFTVAWPSGEFGAMGLEGAVRLGYAKELAAVEDPAERQQLFDSMVTKAYQNGKAINMASFLEIDAVIDPQETRAWLLRGLNAAPRPAPRSGKKRPFVDTW